MKIGLTQMHIAYEDKEANKKQVIHLLEQAHSEQVELIVFPEMTLTGFTMNTDYAGEEMLFSETMQFFKDASAQYGMAIAFGYVESYAGAFYNKLMIVQDGKDIFDYDKIHPFNYSEEGKYYVGGHDIKTISICNTRLSGFVCYDLRFPEIFQAASKDADVILVIANWPESRVMHWKILLQARAIENQCYVIGVNCAGEMNDLTYVESSCAFDPIGERLTLDGSKEKLLVVDVNHAHVKNTRNRFPFKQDRKPELYKELI